MYRVFQNDWGSLGARIEKNCLPPFDDKVPHYTTPNMTSKSLATVKLKKSQESEMMPRVYPTKTSQNILLL
jgi:hypothetical protein